MTDPADLAQRVLVAVAAFVRTLPADQLESLASGGAKLELVVKGGRATPSKAAKPIGRPVEEVRSMLEQIGSRPAGVQYLNDLRLTAPQLHALAKDLGVAVASRARKDAVTTAIVEWVVGRRVDADAIARMSAR